LAFLPPGPGAESVDTERYFASYSTDGRWIGVTRLRFEPEEAAAVFAEVTALSPGAPTNWRTPRRELADALCLVGCRPFEPPTFTALAIDTEPPPQTEGVDVLPVTSFEEHLIGLEILIAAADWPEERVATRRAEAAERFERRQSRPGGEWLAYLDGEPVAWGAATASRHGLLLDGAATRPEARGRGCYRALVRARWDDAVARGTPGLVVEAWEMSRPILERCGFERICVVHEVETGP
jgi:GNAT superfamily N-acetyltransferase